jgi:aminopeptidase N
MANRFTGLLIVAAMMLACAGSAYAETEFAKSAQSEALIKHHQLAASFNPAEHTISATDTITLKPGAKRTLRFALGKDVKVDSLKDDHGKDLAFKPAEDEDLPEHLALYEAEVPKTAVGFTIAYGGVIYDPPQEEATLAHVRGGTTSGVISEEGIYLDAGSGWYPVEDGALPTFSFTLSVPEPIALVTQGDLVSREAKDGTDVSVWRSRVPQDGFTLAGNKFVVKTRRAEGVTLSTYLFAEDAALADKFLDATEKYLRFYTGILGDFPYNRFDIVENFFQTGYGMPGYTLLGDAVVKMVRGGGYDVTEPSGVAHELMHNWWGNYVFFDADQGNWCEAITTYMANYYWLESHGQDEEARQWRKHASVKFSVNAPPDQAYPLREFRGKETEADGVVGYEKGAMFFHHLRRLIGDKAFFAGLRQVIAEHGAGFATWDDFRRAFEQQAGTDLGEMFTQWLDRSGVPDFRVDMETMQETPPSYIARLVQQEPYWNLLLDFRATDEKGATNAEGHVAMSLGEAWVTVGSEKADNDGKKAADGVFSLDPEWNTMRRVPAVALEPCLNAVLNEEGAVVVYPSGADEMSTELLKLVDVIESAGRGLTLLPDSQFTAEVAEGHSLFILGGSGVNRAWDQLGGLIPAGTLTTNEKSFSFQRRVFMSPEDSILATFVNPQRPGQFISVYHGNSPAALARSRYIFFYGWDSYLLFNAGRLTERGMFPPAANPWAGRIPAG